MATDKKFENALRMGHAPEPGDDKPSSERDIVIPKLPTSKIGSKEGGKIGIINKQEIALLFGIFIAYLVLISVLTFLPIMESLRIVGLLIGSFLIGDILQAIKRRMFE